MSAIQNKKTAAALCLLLFVMVHYGSPVWAQAQEFKLPPDVEKLSAKAKETVEVNMEGPMLHWASKFLSAEDPEEQKAAELVKNLHGIYVRSFEFDHEGIYSSDDVESLRSQFRSPTWARVVGVRSQRDGENVDVFFKLEGEKMAGIVIVAAEPKELTFVNIVGPLEVDQLADLSGEFGIPKLNTKAASKSIAKSEKGDHQ